MYTNFAKTARYLVKTSGKEVYRIKSGSWKKYRILKNLLKIFHRGKICKNQKLSTPNVHQIIFVYNYNSIT